MALDAFVHDNDCFDRVIGDQVKDVFFRSRSVLFPVDVGINGKHKQRAAVCFELLIYFHYETMYLRVIDPGCAESDQFSAAGHIEFLGFPTIL